MWRKVSYASLVGGIALLAGLSRSDEPRDDVARAIARPKPLVFDATLYKDRPKFSAPRMTVLYAANMWPKGADRTRRPPEEFFRRYIRKAVKPNAAWVCMDIESFPLTDLWGKWKGVSEERMREGRQDIRWMAAILHDERPGILVGMYFAFDPGRAWPPGSYYRRHSEQNAAALLRHIKGEVDWIAPALYYLWKDDEEQQTERFSFLLNLAKSEGHVVLPFIMPNYHPNHFSPQRHELMPIEDVRRIRDICIEQADGYLVWGSPEPFSNETGWVDVLFSSDK